MLRRVNILICCLIFFTGLFVYVLNQWFISLDLAQQLRKEYHWIIHGITNILGYMTLFLPGYFTYKYINKTNYFNKVKDGICLKALQACFSEEEVAKHANTAHFLQRTTWQEVRSVLFHFIGLQISYLTWGVLQEKVMTQKYTKDGISEHFTDSQFLVFVNRILAFLVSGSYILRQAKLNHCPLYKYVFCSFSNIMSSWCQYEALKYVSFPYQVLAKAAKTVPVMVMGKFISNTKYEYYEYVTSIVLSSGMLLFMLDADNEAHSSITTFSGILLLVFYILFDSFTSNWQGKLFKTYSVSPMQMMCFVNAFSCMFIFISLVQQDVLLKSVHFMFKYPQFMTDCLVISICSLTGQLFIFSTISKFGPLVFAIMTTIRQGFSILLSCLIYHHRLSFFGIVGVVLVFLSIFLRIYCKHRASSIKKKVQRISSV